VSGATLHASAFSSVKGWAFVTVVVKTNMPTNNSGRLPMKFFCLVRNNP
jgi:hypothetical protein